MLTGENGILSQASSAREKTSKAEEEEKIKMAVLGSSIADNGYSEILDEASFRQELTNQFGNDGYDLVVNGDGSFIITVKESQRKYYVNDDKTVINSDNIIEISSAEELANFREDVNSGNSYEGKAVLLTSDITLSGNWTPIGFMDSNTDNKNPEAGENKPFKGIFDGGNHTINNLNISSTENKYNGLFSFVVDGTIRNITIGSIEENNEVTGSSGAGVVGFLYGFEGNISNCTNYADTNGAGIVRIIAGQHTIYNCKNYGTINGSGGIVGGSNGYTGWEEVFETYYHKIINCGNYGSIKSSGNYAGGIAGYFHGNILNCCNKGTVNGVTNAGGIVGAIDGNGENCYNIGDVEGNRAGGILNSASTIGGKAINCYSTGTVTGTGSKGDIVGGEGNIEGNKIVNCYTKDDTFTSSDLGDAFKEDTGENGGYPMLYWE